MRLVLRRWGGFTGKLGMEVRDLDLDRLPSSEAGALEALVRAADFFALPDKVQKSPAQPWDFQHELTVYEAGREHTVKFHESAAPPTLRELVQRLLDIGDGAGAGN